MVSRDAIEYGDADHMEDRMALDSILSPVSPEMTRTLMVKKTAKEAIKSILVGSERACNSTLQWLWRDWELLSFRDDVHIVDFALHLTGMMSSLNH